MNRDSIPLSDVLQISKAYTPILDQALYSYAALRPYPDEVSLKGQKRGSDFRGKRHQIIHTGQFVISRTRTQQRHWGIVQRELDAAVVHRSILCFDLHPELNIQYFAAYLTTPRFEQAVSAARTRQGRLDIRRFLRIALPFPSLDDQVRIAEIWQQSYKILKHTAEMVRSITDMKMAVAGDVFQNKSVNGTLKPLGGCATIESDTAINYPLFVTTNGKLLRSLASSDTDVLGITPNSELDQHFLYFYLAHQKSKWRRSTGTTLSSLETALRALPIPVLSLYEQRKIAAVLHQHDDVLQKLKIEQRELKYLTQGIMQQTVDGTFPVNEAVALLQTL